MDWFYRLVESGSRERSKSPIKPDRWRPVCPLVPGLQAHPNSRCSTCLMVRQKTNLNLTIKTKSKTKSIHTDLILVLYGLKMFEHLSGDSADQVSDDLPIPHRVIPRSQFILSGSQTWLAGTSPNTRGLAVFDYPRVWPLMVSGWFMEIKPTLAR